MLYSACLDAQTRQVFIPNLSANMTYIGKILHKDNDFGWTENHEREWQRLKGTLTAAPVLTFFDLEKFHNYIYGLPTFTVETEHCPLLAIVKKNLNEKSPRIQSMMMNMQQYDLELGKHQIIADVLSRAPLQMLARLKMMFNPTSTWCTPHFLYQTQKQC